MLKKVGKFQGKQDYVTSQWLCNIEWTALINDLAETAPAIILCNDPFIIVIIFSPLVQLA